MVFDWSTFALEVINFLILVWVLKRFFYQPVLKVIEQRRHKITAELDQAAREQAEAETLKGRYETRLSAWEREKQQARTELERQLSEERNRRLQQLDHELARQQEKHRVRDLQQQAQWRRQAEDEALQLGAVFVSRLLTALSGPELDQHLFRLFIDQLASLPESARKPLRENGQEEGRQIEVVSARPLDEPSRGALREALEQHLGLRPQEWRFRQDERLIAGLRVSIGGWLLQANLKDELRFFSEAAHVE